MKLSFNKTDTRKLELWATSRGQGIDDLEAIAALVMEVASAELDKFKPATPTQPEKGASTDVKGA